LSQILDSPVRSIAELKKNKRKKSEGRGGAL
jgi:hypothetical protein